MSRCNAFLATTRIVAVGLLVTGCWNVNGHAVNVSTGLRWLGDARVAANGKAAVVGGAALRFRYGARLYAVGEREPLVESLVGNWGGVELSTGALTGTTELGNPGSIVLFGGRPWLSRRQRWFLKNERFSLLGALLPEAGVTVGTDRGADLYVGWDVPLGGEHFQIVPGTLWLRPTLDSTWLATLAFRVPM